MKSCRRRKHPSTKLVGFCSDNHLNIAPDPGSHFSSWQLRTMKKLPVLFACHSQKLAKETWSMPL
jgi:hypothetical protein